MVARLHFKNWNVEVGITFSFLKRQHKMCSAFQSFKTEIQARLKHNIVPYIRAMQFCG